MNNFFLIARFKINEKLHSITTSHELDLLLKPSILLFNIALKINLFYWWMKIRLTPLIDLLVVVSISDAFYVIGSSLYENSFKS